MPDPNIRLAFAPRGPYLVDTEQFFFNQTEFNMNASQSKSVNAESFESRLSDRIWKVRPLLTASVVGAVAGATAILAALQAVVH